MAARSVRQRRSVVVTGAGTGLGREIALGFAAKGWVVFGTAASAAEVKDLRTASSGRVSLATCDITRIDAVRAWAGGVSDALDGAGLDALISNAGARPCGPIETLRLDTLRHAFDVNVFGAVSVINAFLPALRIARGRIIQMSHWTAAVPLPFDGAAAASNAAIEVLAAIYRAELQPSGIEMMIVAAGDLQTDDGTSASTTAARAIESMTPAERDRYGKRLAIAGDHLDQMHAAGTMPSDAATLVIELAEIEPRPANHGLRPSRRHDAPRGAEYSGSELDALALQLVGLTPSTIKS